jgi:hypothetical protein
VYRLTLHHYLAMSIPSILQPVTLSLDVEIPLHEHPDQTRSRYHHWSSQRLSPSCRPIHEPFTHKVSPRYGISGDSQLVETRIVDVVGSVVTYYACQEGPCSKRARRESGYVFWRGRWWVNWSRVVDARGEGQRGVGLDTVSDGD